MLEPDYEPEVLRWIESFAAEMLRDDLLHDLSNELIEELNAEMPEVRADVSIRRDVEVSTRDLLATFLVEASKDAAAEVEFPPAAVEFARTLARRGHDVGLLLRVYRVGQRMFWSKLMTLVGERIADADLRMAVLQFLWSQMGRVLERNIDLLVAAHSEESEQWLRGALLRRSETVHAVLRGEPVDVDAASERLGHNLHRHQVGLVLWAAESAHEPDPGEALDALAGEIAKVLGAARPLTIRSGARTVWAWLATGRSPDLDRIAGAPMLRRSRVARVAVGVPAPGPQGFVASHREALRAQDVAARSVRDDQVVHYRDVEIVSCLAADEDAMRALVARELSGLAGAGRTLTRLRETVLAYLSVGGSSRVAAEVLGLHKNTVLYRLKQAEELLGRGIEERRLPLELALMLTETYGERVFGAADAG